MTVFPLLLAALLAAARGPAKPGPSRPALKGCAWEKLSDPGLGLEAWVQRCDFGFRKIDLLVRNGSLSVHYSDGGDIYPVVDVYDLLPGETPEAGIRRIFDAKTEKALAAKCVLAPSTEEKPPAGVKRFTFVPNAAYDREIEARGKPDGVPDPPCGDFGESPDGIGYWEVQPKSGARRVLFVRVGQDEPLFDEQTLKILPGR